MANTISDELNRIIQAKTNIRTALQEKCGLTIGDSSTLDEFPGLIQEMEVGGGSSTDTSVVIDLIEGEITNIDIPSGTTKIGEYRFMGCSNLVDVSIPNTVTSIGNYAFQYCNNITQLIIPDSVTSIGIIANMSSLNKIKLSNNITDIQKYFFQNCDSLRTLIIPENVNILYDQAINLKNLNTLYLLNENLSAINRLLKVSSKSPTLMGSNLNNLILLSKTVPDIDYSLFYSISKLQNIYVPGECVDLYKNAGKQQSYTIQGWSDVSSYIKPLASMSYDSQTYTVTALGRDNLELYVDASLCDSSTYTFTPGTEDSSHVITVKSVDPSLGVLDTYTTEVLVEAAAPSYYAAPPTYTVGTPTYTYYQPSNCYKINLPVTFINAELQGYEGQYTTHRLLGLANDDHGSWYSDFSPVDDPDANPTKFYRYYQQNDTNTTLHLHNSVVVVYKDGNNNELYRTDSMNLDSSIVTDYWFKEQLSAPTIDIGQDRTEYFGEITSTDANADTIYYKINDGDWETVTGNTANIANGEISQGDIVYAYAVDSTGTYANSDTVSATVGE